MPGLRQSPAKIQKIRRPTCRNNAISTSTSFPVAARADDGTITIHVSRDDLAVTTICSPQGERLFQNFEFLCDFSPDEHEIGGNLFIRKGSLDQIMLPDARPHKLWTSLGWRRASTEIYSDDADDVHLMAKLTEHGDARV
jgi:hypothetical protein